MISLLSETVLAEILANWSKTLLDNGPRREISVEESFLEISLDRCLRDLESFSAIRRSDDEYFIPTLEAVSVCWKDRRERLDGEDLSFPLEDVAKMERHVP